MISMFGCATASKSKSTHCLWKGARLSLHRSSRIFVSNSGFIPFPKSFHTCLRENLLIRKIAFRLRQIPVGETLNQLLLFPTLPLLNQGERQTLEFRQFPRIRKVVGQITNQVRIGAPITLSTFSASRFRSSLTRAVTMAIVISHLLVIPVLQEMGTGESRLLGDAASDLFALFAVEVPVGQRHEQGRRGYCRAWLRTGYRGFPMVSSPAQPTSDGFNATSAVSPLPAPSPEHIAKRYCTNCGTPCRVSARFCPNCGKQLD